MYVHSWPLNHNVSSLFVYFYTNKIQLQQYSYMHLSQSIHPRVTPPRAAWAEPQALAPPSTSPLSLPRRRLSGAPRGSCNCKEPQTGFLPSSWSSRKLQQGWWRWLAPVLRWVDPPFPRARSGGLDLAGGRGGLDTCLVLWWGFLSHGCSKHSDKAEVICCEVCCLPYGKVRQMT